MKNWLYRHAALLTVMLFLLVIYVLISIVNHHQFRTYAFDLGIYNNAIYDYRNGRANDCMIMQPQYNNLLSDHFELLLMLFAPLSFLFGNTTLLWIQIGAVLGGSWGIYHYLYFKTNDKLLSLLALIYFGFFLGIFTALGFDYHNNVVGSMAIPWIFYFFERQRFIPFLSAFSWLMISKENMALLGIFIATGLLMAHFRNPRQRWWALGASLLAMIYFGLVMKWVMPMLADRPYHHLKYHILGNSFSEILKNVLMNPLKYFLLLFQNHHPNPIHHATKEGFWLCLLWLGGYLMLSRPYLLWMLIPVLGQKLYNDDPTKWGFNVQYAIELAPIMTVGVYLTIHSLKQWGSRFLQKKPYFYYYGSIGLGILLAFISVALTCDRLKDHERIAFWKTEHYQRSEFSVAHLRALVDLVPPDKPLTATNFVVPHLAFREKIYNFPVIHDAEYALVVNLPNDFYLTSYQNAMDSLNYLKSEWKIIAQRDTIMYLLKRNP